LQQDTFSEAVANIQGAKTATERELIPKDSRTQPQSMSGPTKARYTDAKLKEYEHKKFGAAARPKSEVIEAGPVSPTPTATPAPTPPNGELCLLPAGSELKLFLIKTDDDIKLREIFMSEVKRVNDEAGNLAEQSSRQHDRAIHLNLKFEWAGGVGVATATLSNPDGMFLKSFNSHSVASSKLARVLAVHDVVNALFNYLQMNQTMKNAAEEINQDASSNAIVPDLFTMGEQVTKSPTEIASQ
jgi:hypothetical protein